MTPDGGPRPGAGLLTRAGAELADVAARLDAATLEPVVAAIASAPRVMLYGCGREGLMMRVLAMRLHHLGRTVCMQGDLNAFPLGPGDLFLCAAGATRLERMRPEQLRQAIADGTPVQRWGQVAAVSPWSRLRPCP